MSQFIGRVKVTPETLTRKKPGAILRMQSATVG